MRMTCTALTLHTLSLRREREDILKKNTPYPPLLKRGGTRRARRAVPLPGDQCVGICRERHVVLGDVL